MPAEQAIFTSLVRRGKSGYHLVSRSPGLTEPEASAITAWAPSHGALIVDDANRVSVNFQPLPGGRFALSRTCEGRPEYSGRGAKQVYTHVLVIDPARLKQAGFRPFVIYRDALALGYLQYQAEPAPVLKPVPLSRTYPMAEPHAWVEAARWVGLSMFESMVGSLDAGQRLTLPHNGPRASLAEALVGRLPPEAVARTSFTTSLFPSSVRPYLLTLISERRESTGPRDGRSG